VKLGCLYRETMSGTFYPLGAPSTERPMRLSVNVRIPNVVDFVRERRDIIDGQIAMDGFAEGPIDGTIRFGVLGEYRLPYELGFTADDGEEYRLRGQRNLNLLSLRDSVTTLVASVYDKAGREVMRANLRLDEGRGELKQIVRSFRLTYVAGGVA